MAHAILITCFNKFIIKKFLFQVSRLDTNLHRVTKIINDAGTLTYYAVMILIELKEIRLDVTKGNHTLDLSRFDLHIHSPLGKTGNMTVELAADLVLHKLHEFILRAGSLSLSCNHLTLGSVLALLLIITLALRIRTIEIHLQKPVYHSVRITADRRSEMSIELECKTIVTYVVSTIASLRHRTQCKHFDSCKLRLVLSFSQESVQCLCEFSSILSLFHLISEVPCKRPQAGDLLTVRFIMDTIYESLR